MASYTIKEVTFVLKIEKFGKWNVVVKERKAVCSCTSNESLPVLTFPMPFIHANLNLLAVHIDHNIQRELEKKSCLGTIKDPTHNLKKN